MSIFVDRFIAKEEKQVKEKPKVNDYKLKKERQSNLRKLNTLLKKLEGEIEDTEREIGEFEQKLTDASYEELMEYTSKIDSLSTHRDELYEKWEETSLELAELEEN